MTMLNLLDGIENENERMRISMLVYMSMVLGR